MEVRQPLAFIRKLETRRKQLLGGLRLPTEGLPGSLAQSRRRCGSTGCHCHKGEPHLSWTLTFMIDRKKRVEKGNDYKSKVAELMAINAQLLILKRRARKQQQAVDKKKAHR